MQSSCLEAVRRDCSEEVIPELSSAQQSPQCPVHIYRGGAETAWQRERREKQRDQRCVFRRDPLTSSRTTDWRVPGRRQKQGSGCPNLALNLVPAVKIEEGKES